MKKIIVLILIHSVLYIKGQDTFSIVASDSKTSEVGGAGASCVDLFQAGITDYTFLVDLHPGIGSIVTQASYVEINQTNAKNRMMAGDSPAEIIEYVKNNDPIGNAKFRQYGVVGNKNGVWSEAAHTGESCQNYKNHKTGSIDGFHYSIQGNILKGAMVLDSMESLFRNAKGDLACKLMAALQGAKIVGADVRCESNNSSSLFAFLKVSKKDDAYGKPNYSIAYASKNGAKVEPIDSLQKIFNSGGACLTTGIPVALEEDKKLEVFPNPSGSVLTVNFSGPISTSEELFLLDNTGRVLKQYMFKQNASSYDISDLENGFYVLQIKKENRILSHVNFIKQN